MYLTVHSSLTHTYTHTRSSRSQYTNAFKYTLYISYHSLNRNGTQEGWVRLYSNKINTTFKKGATVSPSPQHKSLSVRVCACMRAEKNNFKMQKGHLVVQVFFKKKMSKVLNKIRWLFVPSCSLPFNNHRVKHHSASL